MGYRTALDGTLHVDIAAVTAAANRIDAVAATLYGLRPAAHFDGRHAGRAHAAEGDLIARGLHEVGAALTDWARAAEQIGAALRRSAARYAESERMAAGQLSRP